MLFNKCRFLISTILLTAANVSVAGGFSGGGGNVLNATKVSSPANPQLVRTIVRQARVKLAQYLIQKQQTFKSGTLSRAQADLFKSVFSSKISVVSAVRRIGLSVKMDRPCYDGLNRSFDGSTLGDLPNTICISALNLSRKVEIKQMAAESLALLLHEYAEVIGCTDEIAIKLQKAAFADFQSFGVMTSE